MPAGAKQHITRLKSCKQTPLRLLRHYNCAVALLTLLLFFLFISHARQQRGKAGGDILVTHVQDGSSAL
jgi:hypothetical protein